MLQVLQQPSINYRFCLEQRSKVSETDPAQEFLKMYGGIPQTSSDELNELKKTVSALIQKNEDLEKECEKWKELVLQGILFIMYWLFIIHNVVVVF